MPQSLTYPSWYYGLRGFLFGLVFGCLAISLVYELGAVTVGDPISKNFFFWMTITGAPFLLVTTFEAYFAIRHYRAVRREMNSRIATR